MKENISSILKQQRIQRMHDLCERIKAEKRNEIFVKNRKRQLIKLDEKRNPSRQIECPSRFTKFKEDSSIYEDKQPKNVQEKDSQSLWGYDLMKLFSKESKQRKDEKKEQESKRIQRKNEKNKISGANLFYFNSMNIWCRIKNLAKTLNTSRKKMYRSHKQTRMNLVKQLRKIRFDFLELKGRKSFVETEPDRYPLSLTRDEQEESKLYVMKQHLNYVVYNYMIGQGAFGNVYLGKDMSSNTKVAVKIIKTKMHSEQIRCLQKINSPYVVSLKGFWIQEQNNLTYLVFERCCMSFEKALDRCVQQQALVYFDHIVKGMEALVQNNIIHNDIKMENIMISEDGVAKIVDFGLAKDLGDAQSYIGKHRYGTPNYMAPQILFPQSTLVRYSHKTDLWSLGVLLHRILYKVHPFQNCVLKRNQNAKRQFGVYDLLIDECLIQQPQNRISWPQFMQLYAQIHFTSIKEYLQALKVEKKKKYQPKIKRKKKIDKRTQLRRLNQLYYAPRSREELDEQSRNILLLLSGVILSCVMTYLWM